MAPGCVTVSVFVRTPLDILFAHIVHVDMYSLCLFVQLAISCAHRPARSQEIRANSHHTFPVKCDATRASMTKPELHHPQRNATRRHATHHATPHTTPHHTTQHNTTLHYTSYHGRTPPHTSPCTKHHTPHTTHTIHTTHLSTYSTHTTHNTQQSTLNTRHIMPCHTTPQYVTIKSPPRPECCVKERCVCFCDCS
jgi:hypothetical protein